MVVMVLALPATGVRAQEPSEADELAAARLQQLARIALQNDQSAEHAAAAAHALLGYASRLSALPETHRLYLDSHLAVHQPAPIKDPLGRYLRAAPTDDAAQLQLVRLLIEAGQTAEERAVRWERLLTSESAQQLSLPLRSRAALHAAGLRRELGDDAAFRRLLQQAMKLDETNAAATAAAFDRLAQTPQASPADRIGALLLWHAADPTNPVVHGMVGQSLLHLGQYRSAIGWFESAEALHRMHRPLPPDQFQLLTADHMLALWAEGRASDALRRAERLVSDSTKPATRAELGTLSVELQILLIALCREQDRAALADELLIHVQTLLKQAAENSGDPAIQLQSAWLNLLFDREEDAVQATIAALAESADEDASELQVLRGWLAYRQEQTASAREVLTPLAESDATAAYGLALATSDRTERLRHLAAAARLEPGTLTGVLAINAIAALGEPRPRFEENESLSRLVQQVPPELRNIASGGTRFLSLRVAPTQGQFVYAEPIEVMLSLRNISPIALSVGPNGTVPTTVLLIPRVMVSATEWRQLPPQVVSMDRRLRLAPGEEIETTVQLDGVEWIDALTKRANESLQLSVVAILNPRVTASGDYVPGLLGMDLASRRFARVAYPFSENELRQVLAIVRDGQERQALLGSAWLIRVATLLPPEQETRAAELVQVLHKRFETVSPAGQIWMASFLPTDPQLRQRFDSLLNIVAKSEDAALHTAILAALVRTPDDPLLTTALRRPPGDIRTFAIAWRAVVESMAPAGEQPVAEEESPPPAEAGEGETP